MGRQKGKFLDEFLWLVDIHGRQQQGCGGGGACHKLVAPKRLHSGDSDVDVCVDDQAGTSSECDDSFSVDEGSAMEKLLAKRASMEKVVIVEASAFSWKVMGGPWAKKHLGVDFNSFRAASCSADAQRFCCQYSLCLSASFTLALYGEAVAQTLAE